MTMLESSTPRGFLPEDTDELLVLPVGGLSVAAAVATFRTGMTGERLRVPIVKADPSADWIAEGEEIPLSDAQLDEMETTYRKLAGLTAISNELAADANPDAPQLIGLGLARDIARKLDAAFFGTNGTNAKAPTGLGDLKGVTTLEAPKTWTDLDPFTSAKFAAANLGASITSFIAHPDDAAALAVLKDQSGSVRPLLAASPTIATSSTDGAVPPVLTLDGVPLYTTPAVPAGTVWGLPADRATIAVRQDVDIQSDGSTYFSSDRTAIRAVMRVAFAFPHEAAVVKIVRATA